MTARSSASEDALLIAAVGGGSDDALEQLVGRYGGAVLGLCMSILRDRQLAEEATQDTFVELWRSADRFDPHRLSARAWLLTLARRRAVDRVRREQRHRNIRDAARAAPDDLAPQSEPTPDQSVVAAAVSEDAHQLLSILPDGQREVLLMAYFEGCSQSEIAERTGQALGTVKTWMRRALMTLRRELEAQHGSGVHVGAWLGDGDE